jgi:hypothetical protein
MPQIFIPFLTKKQRCRTSLHLSAKRNQDTCDLHVFPRQRTSFSANGIKIRLIFVPFRHKESGCGPSLFLSAKRNQDPPDVSVFAPKGIKMRHILIPCGEKE